MRKILLAVFCGVFLAAGMLLVRPLSARYGSLVLARETWRSYTHFFIDEKGRVMRRDQGDTVSEGQAYAMLRAVWMNDKREFDRCYAWTEEHLSRRKRYGDHLLAWHWKEGKVADWTAASDADCDYALSLILAHRRWGERAPSGMASYGAKARDLLRDIMEEEVIVHRDGEVYLLPWPRRKAEYAGYITVNPSYYSPAHYRVFYEYTGEARWLSLVDTTYRMLFSLTTSLGIAEGQGLIPDWCIVDDAGTFLRHPEKSADFGWEAVRVPLRVYLDYLWFDSPRARRLCEKHMAAFIEREWYRQGKIFSEYGYDGTADNPFEHPLFYAAYYCILDAAASPLRTQIRDAQRSFLTRREGYLVYGPSLDYFTNSLAWLPEGCAAGIVRTYGE